MNLELSSSYPGSLIRQATVGVKSAMSQSIFGKFSTRKQKSSINMVPIIIRSSCFGGNKEIRQRSKIGINTPQGKVVGNVPVILLRRRTDIMN